MMKEDVCEQEVFQTLTTIIKLESAHLISHKFSTINSNNHKNDGRDGSVHP